jgi:hypothetical protein
MDLLLKRAEVPEIRLLDRLPACDLAAISMLGHCDAVVVGEGELSWPLLVRDFEQSTLRRVYDPAGRQGTTFLFTLAPDTPSTAG